MKRNIIYLFVATLVVITLVLLVYVFGVSNYNLSKNKNENLNIVTSFYPIYIATLNLTEGIDGLSVSCLASPEVGCLHDYQLTVKDMMTLENADVFIINGKGMEAFLDKAISVYPSLEVVDSSENILEEHMLKEHHEDEIEDHDEHHHDHGENSHIWVSIELYIKQLNNITENLVSIDPKNKDKYEKNLSEYVKKLEDLKSKMHGELDSIQNKNIVTFHEAFDYFAEEFDLNIVSVIEREPGTSPNAKEVAEIIDLVENNDVNAIFVEPNYSKTAADTIANETKVKIYELDPIVSGPFDKDAYINIMNKNLETLAQALEK